MKMQDTTKISLVESTRANSERYGATGMSERRSSARHRVEWRTVHSGIWKDPVRGRSRLSRLNLEGDCEGDVPGHGGEQRPQNKLVLELDCPLI